MGITKSKVGTLYNGIELPMTTTSAAAVAQERNRNELPLFLMDSATSKPKKGQDLNVHPQEKVHVNHFMGGSKNRNKTVLHQTKSNRNL